MFSFLTGLNPKVYFISGVLLALVGIGFYINHLQSELLDRETKLEATSSKLKESNENNTKIIEAYEEALSIQLAKAEQKAIAQEQKIEVIKTTSKLKEAVIKRGEIKQDEKSNFTIVTF